MTPKTLKLALAAVICAPVFAAADDAVPAQAHVVRASTERVRIITPPATAPILSRPASTVLGQSGTFSRPESTFSRPQSTFERPGSTVELPRTTLEGTKSRFERPRRSFERRVGAHHRPVTVYVPVPPTIIVEPVIITEPPAETVQVAPEAEAPAAAAKPVIVLDLPPGARIVKPAPTAP